jgi:hypothetical protein
MKRQKRASSSRSRNDDEEDEDIIVLSDNTGDESDEEQEEGEEAGELANNSPRTKKHKCSLCGHPVDNFDDLQVPHPCSALSNMIVLYCRCILLWIVLSGKRSVKAVRVMKARGLSPDKSVIFQVRVPPSLSLSVSLCLCLSVSVSLSHFL